MRLSEAIAMGQHLIHWTSTLTLFDGAGCACGMALASVGERIACKDDFYKHFPWTREMDLWNGISDRFREVMAGNSTLDELIDWVKSIEPAEEEAPVHDEAIQGEPVAAEEPRVLAAK